jgi:hypothetical protein
MDPAVPVAVVERGWLPDQRTTAAPLGRIRDGAARRVPRAPAVVVVGAVAAMADETDGVARSPGRPTAPLTFVPLRPCPDLQAVAGVCRAERPVGVDPEQLAGFTVVLTSDRRSEELTASFARRGARVCMRPRCGSSHPRMSW